MSQEKNDTAFLRPARRQLALPFGDNPCFSWQDFLVDPSNEQARTWLREKAVLLWPEGRLILWGLHGVGKTHLLSAFAQKQDVAVVAGHDLNLEHVLALMHQEKQAAFVLDNAQEVTDEQDLLHLINILGENRIPLLMSSLHPPHSWSVQIKDLQSRLNSTLAIQMRRPSPALTHRLLGAMLRHKEMSMPAKSMHWALKKLPSNGRAITHFVEMLDACVHTPNGRVDTQTLRHCLSRFLAKAAS